MSDNVFYSWLTQESNQFFWKKPMPSEQFDRLMAKKEIQKSIANNKHNQQRYCFIESKIASDYAFLIDFKLTEVFKTLPLSEFQDPSGFERKDKTSFRQKNYFDVRDELEFFLKNDIQQHASPDAQLNAFRRWIDVANLLLKRHCYEGFLLVCVNLQVIEQEHLVNGLPKSIKKNYLKLCNLCSPNGNHKAIRTFMKNNQNDNDFTPLLFNYHAIGMLNEAIIAAREREITLKLRKKELGRTINYLKAEPDFQELSIYKSLLKQKRKIVKQLSKMELAEQEQLAQRDQLLNAISLEQKRTTKELPTYLEQTYQRIKSRFNKLRIEQAVYANQNTLTPNQAQKKPTLYSEKLLPGFWSRKGKKPENYWGEVFISGHNPMK